MSLTTRLPAIPWSHEGSEFGSVWVWETPHFIVTVNGDNRSFYYQVADKMARPGADPRPLADGQAASFEHAEQLIRETIGKSYPPSLDYRRYAGALATTFTIADGTSIDLGPYTGRDVHVIAVGADGTDLTFTGRAHIENYDLVIDTPISAVRISPTYLRSITTTQGRNLAPAEKPQQGTSRTTRGTVEPACTGRYGYLPGTVEHSGLPCPVHEGG